MNKVEQLKEENKQLRQLARKDPLTGLLNRSAFEKEAVLALERHGEGLLLMIDLDKFKKVNDQYGHFTGDQVLCNLAKILGVYFFPKDLVGRMGGDEFAVFLSGRYPKEALEERVSSLKARFMQTGEKMGIGKKLTLTVGAATAAKKDTFQNLYQCADLALLRGKKNAASTILYYSVDMANAPEAAQQEKRFPAFSLDVLHIRRHLREQEPQRGAYCPDYDKFIAVYHFLERGLSRSQQPIPLILVSLTDRISGDFPQPERRPGLMQVLTESIQTSLRCSDVFTQYSSVQFLVMAPGADENNIILIQERMKRTMWEALPEHDDVELHFSCYPLQSAFEPVDVPVVDETMPCGQ